jgi:GLPGLI family protein
MKQYFTFLFALSLPAIAFSQINIQRSGPQKSVKYEALDKGALRVLYEVKSIHDVSKPDKTETDYRVLEIGERGISHFYSDNRRRMDSVMTEMLKNRTSRLDMRNVLSDNGISSSGDQKDIFRNYPFDKITVTDRIASTDYLYEEPLEDVQIPWKTEVDTKEILSYSCQKATSEFRGRRYEAWFAPDLPINSGPWKFSGLPGLILAVEDSDKNFSFQAIGIENSTLPILFPKKDYVKTSRKEMGKIQKRYAESPVEFMTNSMPGAKVMIKVIDEDGNEKIGKEVKFPYNPIELE